MGTKVTVSSDFTLVDDPVAQATTRLGFILFGTESFVEVDGPDPEAFAMFISEPGGFGDAPVFVVDNRADPDPTLPVVGPDFSVFPNALTGTTFNLTVDVVIGANDLTVDYTLIDLVNGGTPETGQLIVPTIAIPQGNWFGYAIDRNSLGPASTIFFDNYSVSFTPADPSLTGDLNGDGFVGIADLSIVLGNWNQNVTPGDPLAGDPSGDGFVGINDLNEVLGNWNAGTPPAAAEVPEPTALTLLGTGAVLGLTRRTR